MSENNFEKECSNLEKECSICFDLVDDSEHQLICNHYMHKSCYNNFLKSPAIKKCPMCRTDIFKDMNLCQICKKDMNIDPAVCEVVQSNICGCIYHYNCLKSAKIYYCERCQNFADIQNSDALSYLYFPTGHKKWLGRLGYCKNEGCEYYGIPTKFGYCDSHSKEKTTNKALILSFIYFIRYIDEEDINKRNDILLDIIRYMDKYHKYDNPEDVNFVEIRENLML